MEVRELRAFVAVAEHGGVARAAGALYLSPSSVSHAITTLEREVGAQLFHRLARGMVLTDAGKAVLGPARRALQEIASAETAAGTVEGLITGRITVLPGRIFLSPVVRLVARFHAEHPNVVLRVAEPENGPVIADLVRTGDADFGVMLTDAVPSDLEAVPIGDQTTALVVPANHPLAQRASVTVADLDGLDMIGPEADSPFRELFDELCRRSGSTPRIVAETSHLQTMLELVCRGVGATVATMQSDAPIADGGVVFIPLEPDSNRAMSMVTRAKAPRTPAAEAFWQFVAVAEPAG